jgi:hypothetical protein
MLIGLSIVALLIGVVLFYIDEVSFHDECCTIGVRRLGIGNLGVGFAAGGVATLLMWLGLYAV